MPRRCEGEIRIEECRFHKEVVWEFDYPQSYAWSPVFVNGNQNYQLRMSLKRVKKIDYLNVDLYRKGPSNTASERSVRWWAGLRHHDGRYSLANECGILDLRVERESFFWAGNLKNIRAAEVQDQLLTVIGRLTFFLRLGSQQASPSARGCIHGAIKELVSSEGSIRDVMCPFHTEVQWKIPFRFYFRDHLVSPEFVIGNQRYRLELVTIDHAISMNLYRSGDFEKGEARSCKWWAGLKRPDGSYSHRIKSGELNLRKKLMLSSKVKNLKNARFSEFYMGRNGEDEDITVFFLLSRKRALATGEVCIHGDSDMHVQGDGVVQMEECPSHKYVEWKINCRPLLIDGRILASSVFVIENQHYLLELSLASDICLALSLFRRGPSMEGPRGTFRWWAGLKRKYYGRSESGNLHLWQNCEMWTSAGSLVTVPLKHLNRVDECITFFLYISGEKPSEASDVCDHDTELLAWKEVSFREETYPACKVVEWEVDYEDLPDDWSFTSPFFVLLDQYYFFQFRRCDDSLEFILHKSFHLQYTPKSVRFSAELKFSDGTYSHRTETKKLDFGEDSSEYYTPICLKEITEMEEAHLTPSGRIGFFFWANHQSSCISVEPLVQGVIGEPMPYEGSIRNEESRSYAHVEWNTVYSQEYRSMKSPEFVVRNNRYFLELSFEWHGISLHLYRKELSCKRDMMVVRCWAGLKRGDGYYYHRNFRGKLNLRRRCQSWTKVKFLYKYQPLEVERHLLSSCGTLNPFFRVTFGDDHRGRPANGASELIFFDSVKLPSQRDGNIKEKERAYRKEVEWSTDYEPLRKEGWVSVSPEFTFLDQHFLFHLNLTPNESTELQLYRLGPQTDCCLRWWTGLKRRDGSYHHRIKSGELNLKWRCELWESEYFELKHIKISQLELERLGVGGNLTFFLILSEATSETSIEGFSELPTESFGVIREQQCSSHSEVEWDISLPDSSFSSLWSPGFKIGNQNYLLELSRIFFPGLQIYIYRMGPSVCESDVRYWVGLKESNRSYYHYISRGILDLKKNYEFWNTVEDRKVCYLSRENLPREHFESSKPLTFFCRIGVQRPSSPWEACPHDSFHTPERSSGSLREEECGSHKYVEWEIDHKPEGSGWILTSPSFVVENQVYIFTFSPNYHPLSLYRMGPCVDGPAASVRWWIATYCGGGIYDYRNRCGKVDLKEECEIWRKVESMSEALNWKEVLEILPSGRGLVFSFWMSLQRPWISLDVCNHVSTMMFVPRSGSLTEEEWSSCKQVVWDIDCIPPRDEEIITSPTFSIGSQQYLININGKGEMHLFRMGPAANAAGTSARWIMGVKHRDDTYDHFLSKCGKLDLEEACEIWTNLDWIYVGELLNSYRMIRLSIFFLVSVERDQTTTEANINGAEVPQNSEIWRTDVAIFKVQGKELKVHRAVLRIRVPVLEAMFRHDTQESRTGVVHIEDCELTVFKMFLRYAETGELPNASIDDFFALYLVADKYLMDPLKVECLTRIEKSFYPTFFDTVKLIVRYGYEDLFEKAAESLSQRKYLTKGDRWRNFEADYPEVAHELEIKAFGLKI